MRRGFDLAPDPSWMTTGDVARLLDVTSNGVRWLEREGEITCRRTLGGIRLFARAEVMRLVAKRAERAATARHPLLATVRVRMAKATADGARQIRFRLEAEAKLALQEGEVKRRHLRLVRGRVA